MTSNRVVDHAVMLEREELHAETPAEFCGLLDRIRTAADLTCGQIAAKTGMPRSQAYNMVAKNRTSLPSRRDQVAAFTKACNLAPLQVDIVLDLWGKLNDQQVQQRAQSRATTGFVADILSDRGDPVEPENLAKLLAAETGRTVNVIVNQPPQLPRNASLLELVHYVVAESGRTRRAMQLLALLGAMLTLLVASVAMLATWVPGTAGPALAAAGAAVAAISTASAAMRHRRRREDDA
jgi:hypothetical protein